MRAFFEQHHLKLEGKTLLLAVSAGPDSMALLEMLRQLQEQVAFKLVAAHFDHQLRPDSGRESELLKAYCQKYRLPLREGKWPTALQPQAGVEAAARHYRYQFLAQVAAAEQADYLLTAHHGDDLLENILLKLIRSGNPSEMNSLPAVSDFHGLKLLRPLLTYAKADLLAFDQQQHLPYILDASNRERGTLRNRLRLDLIPQLKQENPRLLAHANFFAQQMSVYSSICQQLLPADWVLGTWRVAKKDLAPWQLDQQQVLLSQLIWQKWHLRRPIRQDLRQPEVDLADFKILNYGPYYYLLKKESLPVAIASKKIDLGQAFSWGSRQLLLSPKKVPGQLIGSFYSDQADFTASSQVKVFLAKNGHHIKAKKEFAAHGIPALLRPRCLSILAGGRSVFTEHAYQNQLYRPEAQRYYLYEL